MLDPRIYRMGLVVVVVAVIVLAFSLADQPGALHTNLAPDAYSGQNAWATMNALADRYPRRRPGSVGDRAVAAYVAAKLRSYGLAVSTDRYQARTVDGPRELENVVGIEAGLGQGTIALVTHRDALRRPARAELSGTAVMLELARVLSGETQQHTIALASISGSLGAVGAARLVRRLPQPVDAVLVLGDLAGVPVREPVVVPWSDGQKLAPPALRNTVIVALAAQAGVATRASGVPGQIAHLAFPLSGSEQAPFDSAGTPAVLISLAGERAPAADEATSLARISAMGRAVLESVNALDGAGPLPGPSSYLIWAGKVVPAWALRLLVLALIIPVGAATIDAAARARRRGHRLLGWVVWVLSAALPFVLVALLAPLARLTGIIGFAPALPLPGGLVPLGAGGVAVLALAAAVLLAGLAWLRPAVVVVAGPSRRARADPLPGAASAVMVVLCLTTFVAWLGNPYAALLLVPALHLWLWVVIPDVRPRAHVLALLLAAGLALPALALAYCAVTLGVGPVGLAWSFLVELAGGAVGWPAAIEWSVAAGCALSVAAIALRRALAPGPEPVAVTVRGPVSYAGPGSLGGTESALRR
jgi:hypothetical protein